VAGHASDERLSDERLSDERLSDERLSDERLSDERLSDERLSDERPAQLLSHVEVFSNALPPLSNASGSAPPRLPKCS